MILHRGIAAILFLGASTLTLQTERAFSHFAGPTGATGCTVVNRTEDANLSIWNDNVNVENVVALNAARLSYVDPTDVNTSAAPSAFSADVRVMDADYTTQCGVLWHDASTNEGIVGFAPCIALHSSPLTGFCDRHHIMLDTSFTTPASVTTRLNLATHELGHTVGAYHESSPIISVMQVGYPKPTSVYGTHVVGEINNAFPP